MSIVLSKRNLLSARNSGWFPMRPPWAIDEASFIEQCTRCADCAKACPKKIITMGDGGFPEVSFKRQGCDFCEHCVDICNRAALSKQQPAVFRWSAVINNSCFSMRGVVCRSCGEICDSRAITFKALVGGITQVHLSSTSCSGCGECISICPADAITLKTTRQRQERADE